MIARVLLVAIFGSVLYFEAEANYPPKKCNNEDVAKVYAWWHANGGIPQHMTEHNVRCHPREVAVLSTPGFFDQEVTCAVMYHYAASHTIYYKNKDNITLTSASNLNKLISGIKTHEAVTFDWSGANVEQLHQNIRLEIAEVDGMRLLHVCSLRSDAEVGRSEYLIKGDEGKVSEKGVKALQELLVKEFGVKETLRKYSETCRLPFESEGTQGGDSHCSSGPCTHH